MQDGVNQCNSEKHYLHCCESVSFMLYPDIQVVVLIFWFCSHWTWFILQWTSFLCVCCRGVLRSYPWTMNVMQCNERYNRQVGRCLQTTWGYFRYLHAQEGAFCGVLCQHVRYAPQVLHFTIYTFVRFFRVAWRIIEAFFRWGFPGFFLVLKVYVKIAENQDCRSAVSPQRVAQT